MVSGCPAECFPNVSPSGKGRHSNTSSLLSIFIKYETVWEGEKNSGWHGHWTEGGKYGHTRERIIWTLLVMARDIPSKKNALRDIQKCPPNSET
jgi:hypothetical protein